MSEIEIVHNAFTINNITFPGGEKHVSIDCRNPRGVPEDIRIRARICDAGGVMSLLLVTDSLKRMGVKNISLDLPYVPYARQDRVCNEGEAHSLKVFATLINAQGYKRVTVFDPHSDVVEALFDNVNVVSNHEFIKDALHIGYQNEDFYLIAPDAGAYKKIFYLGKYLASQGWDGIKIVTCNKERNTKTGAISNFSVGATDLGGKRCVVVDDICDAGGTFLGLADALKAANAGPLDLIVSHGIFSRGVEVLTEKFERVIFTDSFQTFGNKFPFIEEFAASKIGSKAFQTSITNYI